MRDKDREFNIIVMNLQEKIFNYLFKLISNKEDSEDILQKIFIKFYEKMETINRKAYESYIFKSAYNEAVNVYRRRSKKKKLNTSLFNIKNIFKNVKDEEETNNDKNEIQKILETLSLREKNVIELKIFQKKSYKEIAKITGSTESAVDSLLVRTKRKLRKKMSNFK